MGHEATHLLLEPRARECAGGRNESNIIHKRNTLYSSRVLHQGVNS